MSKNSAKYPQLKELERLLWRNLQETFSKVMIDVLEDIDQEIAENRDTKRYRLQDKRIVKLESLFGELEVRRNYYFDRETRKYVSLLDQSLQFDGASGLSPLVEEAAIELAVTSPSYRKAANTLETFLGYRVTSHESIRQRLLQASSIPKERQPVVRSVLFVETDGLYVKSQEKRKKGRETKIAAAHQGWEVNGKRVRLKGKRHYVHRGKEPFWEGFEQFLVDTFEYDPTTHLLIINGDGASWITACRDYFKGRAFFTLDRFHVARDLRQLFRGHPRYKEMKQALRDYDGETLLLELNSAVGTLNDGAKEERLESLIQQLSQYPESLEDYRKWLAQKGIATEGMRPMGAAEGTMSVFAKRLKQGRSWVENGAASMFTCLVAYLDKLPLQTLLGRIERWNQETEEENPPKYYKEKIVSSIGEATRDNLPYLRQTTNRPIHQALQALKGF